jgi:tetratricopeptide (TPR) repeat protein
MGTHRTRLQAVRKQLGYTAAQVVDLLTKRAAALNIPVMDRTSLLSSLSYWENGRRAVSLPHYRRLFREIYGRTNEELGFPADAESPEAEELRTRLARARTVDLATVELFRAQVDHTRRMDRRFGGITLLDQLRSQITEVHGLLTHACVAGHRQRLAAVLVEACTLAGWQSLDRNAVGQAYDHYERAKTAAREAESPALLAHAIAEQAFVLIDIGDTTPAVDQLAERCSSVLLRAWLAAAHGEGLAAAGHRDDALRAFDAADALLPTTATDPDLPFLVLGGPHLHRWRGNILARLGEPNAIDRLTTALRRLPAEFVRARTGMLVDLAYAYAAAADRDAALDHARQARRLAAQIKSDRHQRRLDALELPGSS